MKFINKRCKMEVEVGFPRIDGDSKNGREILIYDTKEDTFKALAAFSSHEIDELCDVTKGNFGANFEVGLRAITWFLLKEDYKYMER